MAVAIRRCVRALVVLLVLTGFASAQPSITSTFEQCTDQRRARMAAAARIADPATRSQALEAIPRCERATDASPAPPWRYDVRVGGNMTGMMDAEAEGDSPRSPSGIGLSVDTEAGPRPRWNELAVSLTLVAAYTQFKWRDPDPRSFFRGSYFNFIDLGLRGSVHLGPVRLGLGLGAELGFNNGSQGGLLPFVEAIASVDVPTGTRIGVSVFAVAHCSVCIVGWSTTRIGAGVTF